MVVAAEAKPAVSLRHWYRARSFGGFGLGFSESSGLARVKDVGLKATAPIKKDAAVGETREHASVPVPRSRRTRSRRQREDMHRRIGCPWSPQSQPKFRLGMGPTGHIQACRPFPGRGWASHSGRTDINGLSVFDGPL
jgi:hypothetical protein